MPWGIFRSKRFGLKLAFHFRFRIRDLWPAFWLRECAASRRGINQDSSSLMRSQLTAPCRRSCGGCMVTSTKVEGSPPGVNPA